MKPALSIVFFTVSAGAGLGLFALIVLADLLAPQALPERALWRGELLALVLVAAGLLSSTLHLANPKNAWRSFSRFRTSWLSREAVFAVAFFPIALAYIALAYAGTGGSWHGFLAFLSLLLAWAVLLCTAMIYACLKPIRQWHTAWTPVNYVLLGHWTGAVLLLGMVRVYGGFTGGWTMPMFAIGVIALAAKLGYWFTMRDASAAPTLERAIGVREGVRPPGATVAQARLLDTGHSHGTFLTNEFGFQIARRHATALRVAALALGFVVPLGWILFGNANAWCALATAVFCIIGVLAERWLFFAEARHTVRLYHGDPRT